MSADNPDVQGLPDVQSSDHALSSEQSLNSPPRDMAATLFNSMVIADDLKQLLTVQARQLPANVLAYLGDAVYELYARTHCLFPLKRSQAYHQQVVAQVRAERQATHLLRLQPLLTDYEQSLLKRGRNAATGRPKRVEAETYRQASSLEALIGYLYLTDPQRLAVLLRSLDMNTL